MKSKLWLKYLGYIILISGLMYLNGYVSRQQALYIARIYQFSLLFPSITMLIKISLGSLLGLESIIDEIKKKGSWKLNVPKFVLIVIPLMYLSYNYFIGYYLPKLLIDPIFMLLVKDNSLMSISQLIFGYFLITSFYKQSEETKEDTV